MSGAFSELTSELIHAEPLDRQAILWLAIARGVEFQPHVAVHARIDEIQVEKDQLKSVMRWFRDRPEDEAHYARLSAMRIELLHELANLFRWFTR